MEENLLKAVFEFSKDTIPKPDFIHPVSSQSPPAGIFCLRGVDRFCIDLGTHKCVSIKVGLIETIHIYPALSAIMYVESDIHRP
jgi:hypothetical protein